MGAVRRWVLIPMIATVASFAGADVATASQPGDTEHGVNRKKLAKKAEAVIETRNGIDVLKISRCGPQKKKGGRLNFSIWICEWRARGIWPGEVPYACAGDSKWKRKKSRWMVEGCANSLQPQVPLLATPNPHPLYGLNDDWANHLLMNGPLHALKILNLLDDTHSDVIRMNMLWSVVEKKQGTYDWNAFDELNAIFKAHGMRPLWVILAAPCWAQQNPAGCSAGNDKLRPAPAYYDELAKFSAAAAARYGDDAVGFEVWNEPNYPRFWGGEIPDPADYSNMFKQVADAIHAAVPGTAVATGGLSPHADSDKHAIGFSNFVKALYENGAAQRADAIGVHPYASVGPGEDYIGDVRVYLGKIQGAMRAAGDATTPMWATEFGISTTGPHAYSADGQAQALTDVYEMMRRVDSVPLVIVNGLVDNPGLAEREAGWGLLNPDLTKKPAFCVLTVLRGFGC